MCVQTDTNTIKEHQVGEEQACAATNQHHVVTSAATHGRKNSNFIALFDTAFATHIVTIDCKSTSRQQACKLRITEQKSLHNCCGPPVRWKLKLRFRLSNQFARGCEETHLQGARRVSSSFSKQRRQESFLGNC